MCFGVFGVVVGFKVDARCFMASKASPLDKLMRDLIWYENASDSAKLLFIVSTDPNQSLRNC